MAQVDNDDERIIQLVAFRDIQQWLSHAGFVFRPGLYAFPGMDPLENERARHNVDYFLNLEDFRANLCRHGVPAWETWTKEQRQSVGPWVRNHILADVLMATSTTIPNLEEITSLQAFGLLKKLGFRHKWDKLAETWFFPGVLEGSVPKEPGVTEFSGDWNLTKGIIRFGFPENIEWNKLSRDEQIQLVTHFANLPLLKPDLYGDVFQRHSATHGNDIGSLPEASSSTSRIRRVKMNGTNKQRYGVRPQTNKPKSRIRRVKIKTTSSLRQEKRQVRPKMNHHEWLPADWEVRTIWRTHKNGQAKTFCNYEYVSPKGWRLRSKVAAQEYIELIAKENGDEERAMDVFKERKGASLEFYVRSCSAKQLKPTTAGSRKGQDTPSENTRETNLPLARNKASASTEHVTTARNDGRVEGTEWLPPGWKVDKVLRKDMKSPAYRNVYIAPPPIGYKFRTRKAVEGLMDLMKSNEGNQELAWKAFKESKGPNLHRFASRDLSVDPTELPDAGYPPYVCVDVVANAGSGVSGSRSEDAASIDWLPQGWNCIEVEHNRYDGKQQRKQYIAPIGYRFLSRKAVEEYLYIVASNNGDEERAMAVFKDRKGAAHSNYVVRDHSVSPMRPPRVGPSPQTTARKSPAMNASMLSSERSASSNSSSQNHVENSPSSGQEVARVSNEFSSGFEWLPPGWKIMEVMGNGSAQIKHTYYIAPPSIGYKFRTKTAAQEYIELIKRNKGNQELAWTMFKARKGTNLGAYANKVSSLPLVKKGPGIAEQTPASTDDKWLQLGWEVKTVNRTDDKGTRHRRSQYFLPASIGYKFLSRKAAQEYIDLKEENNGNLELAWTSFKERKGEKLKQHAARYVTPLFTDVTTGRASSPSRKLRVECDTTSRRNTTSTSATAGKKRAFEEVSLPAGWVREKGKSRTKRGKSGCFDYEYVSPAGGRFRSKKAALEYSDDVRRHRGSELLAWDDFKQRNGSKLRSFAQNGPSSTAASPPGVAQASSSTSALSVKKAQVDSLKASASVSTSNKRPRNKGGSVFYVEDVLARRKSKHHFEYEVKWKDYPEEENTWEPRSNIDVSNDVRQKIALVDKADRQDQTFKMIAAQRNEEFLVQWSNGKPDCWLARPQLVGKRVITAANTFALRKHDQGNIDTSNDPLPFCQSSRFARSPSTTDNGAGVLPVARIEKIVIKPVGRQKKEAQSFLDVWAQGPVLKYEYTLTDQASPLKELVENGTTYEAICAKVNRQKGGGSVGQGGMSGHSSWHHSASTVNVYYVPTSGPGLERINLQAALERVSDFRALTVSKAPSRLELLCTPSLKDYGVQIPLDDAKSEFIDEACHMGCGFIPESTLQAILGNTAKAKRADSIQVRIFGPRIGTLKGMLFKKPGITKIQLPSSMQKLGPSRTHTDRDNWMAITVKGEFPSQSNWHLGRALDPLESDPPEDFNSTTKPLSKMYQNVLVGLGVPRRVMDSYVSRARRSGFALKHTHLKGVADPTGCLPPGTVFVTGHVGNNGSNNKNDNSVTRHLFGRIHPQVLVTRSPCMEPSDLKLVDVVHTRPSRMSLDQWNFLCNLKFGHVVFAPPRAGHIALPELVGEGDLDGDDYCVFWDDELLKELKDCDVLHQVHQKLPAGSSAAEKGGPSSRRAAVGSSDWFSKAQTEMLRLDRYKSVNQLTSQLYRLCQKTAAESSLFEPDVHVLAQAYKTSLDLLKHGGRINLPRHLREQLKLPAACLKQYCTTGADLLTGH